MPPSHGGDQGFESPTGYQKPLTFDGWFFAFVFLFLLKPRIQKRSREKGFESPTGYQKPLTLNGWFFAFLIYFFAEATNTEAQ